MKLQNDFEVLDFASLPQPVAVMAISKADIAKTYIFFIRFTSIFCGQIVHYKTTCAHSLYAVPLLFVRYTARAS